jgi:hypothetical protein
MISPLILHTPELNTTEFQHEKGNIQGQSKPEGVGRQRPHYVHSHHLAALTKTSNYVELSCQWDKFPNDGTKRGYNVNAWVLFGQNVDTT